MSSYHSQPEPWVINPPCNQTHDGIFLVFMHTAQLQFLWLYFGSTFVENVCDEIMITLLSLSLKPYHIYLGSTITYNSQGAFGNHIHGVSFLAFNLYYWDLLHNSMGHHKSVFKGNIQVIWHWECIQTRSISSLAEEFQWFVWMRKGGEKWGRKKFPPSSNLNHATIFCTSTFSLFHLIEMTS